MSERAAFYVRLGVLVVVAAALPPFLGAAYQTAWVLAGLSAFTVLGLVLLMGFTGQPSLGQAAFYGIGAYAVAIGTTALHWSFAVAMLAGLIAAGLGALVVGWAIFRLHGHFLALATLALGSIVYTVMSQSHLTGGAIGISAIPPIRVLGHPVMTPLAYGYLVWGVLALGLVLARAMTGGPSGLALRAVRDNEPAARSLGISPLRYKLAIFVVSAVFAAVGGCLYAPFITYVSADPFDIMASIQFLLMAIIGGMYNLFGAVVGTVVVAFLTDGLTSLASALNGVPPTMLENVVFGALLAALVLLRPQGIMGGRTAGGRALKRLPRPTAGAGRPAEGEGGSESASLSSGDS